MKPRTYSKKEVRQSLLHYIKSLENYWLTLPDKTIEERMDGLIFSILVTFDGESVEFPAMDIVLSPHPSDEEYNKAIDSNWFKDGMKINDDSYLHEEWCKIK